jgi:hypothetical protein
MAFASLLSMMFAFFILLLLVLSSVISAFLSIQVPSRVFRENKRAGRACQKW